MYISDDTLIHVENLVAGYKNKTTGVANVILRDINLTEYNIIREGYDATGQVIAVLGRSGRGKSTLFKTLTGLLKPLEGDVLINDVYSGIKDKSKILSEGDVGFVDQKYTLFRHKTVLEICKYASNRFKKQYLAMNPNLNESDWKKYQDELIYHYLEDWGLIQHKDKYSCDLSGGQRQRTAIIEQLLANKHFMILDEPFSGLDIGNIEKVKESFKRIGLEHEMNTIIFSTHDINLAVELADSIYILGHPTPDADYSTIVKHIDMKERKLAWREFGPEHVEVVKEVKQIMLET